MARDCISRALELLLIDYRLLSVLRPTVFVVMFLIYSTFLGRISHPLLQSNKILDYKLMKYNMKAWLDRAEQYLCELLAN